MSYVDIVFDGPPSHEPGRFVEVENSEGCSIKFGEWVQRPDGYWVLRLQGYDLNGHSAGDRMIADNDCEDQGFTRIEDGCYHCLPTFKDGKPVRTPLVMVERLGHSYWQCPKCLGYYGPAPLAPSRSHSSGGDKP